MLKRLHGLVLDCSPGSPHATNLLTEWWFNLISLRLSALQWFGSRTHNDLDHTHTYHVGVVVILWHAIPIMALFVSSKFGLRWFVTREKYYSLAEKYRWNSGVEHVHIDSSFLPAMRIELIEEADLFKSSLWSVLAMACWLLGVGQAKWNFYLGPRLDRW